MYIPDEIKNSIIDMFVNKNMKISKILKAISPNGEYQIEDVYDVLTEYKEKNNVVIKRTKMSLDDMEQVEKKIYDMRQSKLSFENITNYLNNRGINISIDDVKKKYKEYCKTTGVEERVNKQSGRKAKKISNDRIYELRMKRLSYEVIAKLLQDETGIPVTWYAIRARCKKIFSQKGEEEPEVEPKNKGNKPDIDDDEIVLLVHEGWSYRTITQYYQALGVNVSYEYVRKRYLEMSKEKQDSVKNENGNESAKETQMKDVDLDKIKNALLLLKQKKAATNEQLQTLIDYYEIDLNATDLEESKEL